MGCGIHGRVQARYVDGAWWDAGEIENSRSYATFAILAGVRGDEQQAIALPRGLPDDFQMDAEEYRVDDEYGYWMGDHSYSWLTLRECLERTDWPPVFAAWLAYLATKYQVAVDPRLEVRLVFGFDS